MKKLIMLLAITISTLSAFAGGGEVSQKVLDAFKSEFTTASRVTWTEGSDHYKADFIFNGQQVSAYYSTEGELLGLSRYITSLDLPMNLQVSLKKNYAGYWISDLFELTMSDATGYYITLENADSRIVLKAGADSEWSVYKKARKV